MTTDAERLLFYRLAVENAHKGAVVELGAWLGASSAWIAAGMRDSGVGRKAHVYDRFKWDTSHVAKVKRWNKGHGGEGGIPSGTCFSQFWHNLGPLMAYVEPHQGEITKIKWGDDPVSVLICDAPKRVPAIASVLKTFRKALQPGSFMAWQDFGHFPSFEIPACLYRIRGRLEFVEAVVPGTTLAFKVLSQWEKTEVSSDGLALLRWTADEIETAWDYWLQFVPPQKASLFRCGAALFLCDIGQPKRAVGLLTDILTKDAKAVLPKWDYLGRNRADLVVRYAPLFDLLRQDAIAA